MTAEPRVLSGRYRIDEPIGFLARRSKYVKRQPLRAFCADAGESLELLDQAGERCW